MISCLSPTRDRGRPRGGGAIVNGRARTANRREGDLRPIDAGGSGRARSARQLLDADAVAELAERLAGAPFRLEAHEDRDELGDDAIERDVVLELDVEAIADRAATEE